MDIRGIKRKKKERKKGILAYEELGEGKDKPEEGGEKQVDKTRKNLVNRSSA